LAEAVENESHLAWKSRFRQGPVVTSIGSNTALSRTQWTGNGCVVSKELHPSGSATLPPRAVPGTCRVCGGADSRLLQQADQVESPQGQMCRKCSTVVAPSSVAMNSTAKPQPETAIGRPSSAVGMRNTEAPVRPSSAVRNTAPWARPASAKSGTQVSRVRPSSAGSLQPQQRQQTPQPQQPQQQQPQQPQQPQQTQQQQRQQQLQQPPASSAKSVGSLSENFSAIQTIDRTQLACFDRSVSFVELHEQLDNLKSPASSSRPSSAIQRRTALRERPKTPARGAMKAKRNRIFGSVQGLSELDEARKQLQELKSKDNSKTLARGRHSGLSPPRKEKLEAMLHHSRVFGTQY